MKRIFAATLMMSALLVLSAGRVLACPYVFVVNFSGQFGLMDVATGVFIPLGKGLENTPDGIAGAPGGPFYTVDGVTGHLLRFSLNGNVTDVGDTHTGANVGPSGVSLVGALQDGTMYAIDFSNKLLLINTDTGNVKALGTLSLPTQEMDYSGNMVTSLTGDGSKLYYTLEIFEGPRKLAPTIFTIDPGKLTITRQALKTANGVIGSGMINGSLYLFSAFGSIYKVDPSTGEGDVVSFYDSSISPIDPPFTGVFGAVGTVEPYTVRQAAPRDRASTSPDTSTHAWPARHLPRGTRPN